VVYNFLEQLVPDSYTSRVSARRTEKLFIVNYQKYPLYKVILLVIPIESIEAAVSIYDEILDSKGPKPTIKSFIIELF